MSLTQEYVFFPFFGNATNKDFKDRNKMHFCILFFGRFTTLIHHWMTSVKMINNGIVVLQK